MCLNTEKFRRAGGTYQQALSTHISRAHERVNKAETDRDQARAATAAAREDAATLRGPLEAIRTQNEAMLSALTPAPADPHLLRQRALTG